MLPFAKINMKNKNAILRYEVINECLTTRKGHTITDLVRACNERYSISEGCENLSVTSRQVLKDMEAMKDIYGVKIESERDPKDHRFVRFSYEAGTNNIHGDRLLDKDYGDLNQALLLMETFVELPDVQKAANAIKKRLGNNRQGWRVFSLETNSRLRNFDQLGSYINAIVSGNPLRIHYMVQYEYERVFLFQPYFLKQYNGRWFLFGWNYDFEKNGIHGIIQNLAIDRIAEKRVDKSRFSQSNPPRQNDIDFDHYFDDIIGVTKLPWAKVEHIVIRANDKNDKFRLMTKPIHITQQIVGDDNMFTLDVRPNPELYAVLRQFEHIEVVSPANVREEFLQRLGSIQDQYK